MKNLYFGLALVTVSCLLVSKINAQSAKTDSTYRRWFVGSSLMMLGNLIPDDPNPPEYIQLNVGYVK